MPFKPPVNNTIDNLLTNTMSNSFINNYIGVSQLGALGTNTKNINDLLKNNVIYSFSLYNYEYGNHHFTSINFCLKGDKVISENDFYFYKQFTDHCQAD